MDLGDILQMRSIIKDCLKLDVIYDDFNNCILSLEWHDVEGKFLIDTINLGVKAQL